MNANDSRLDQEITDLARMLPVMAERDLPAGRQHLLKEHLMAEVQAATPRFRSVSFPKFRTGIVAIASAVATLAIVVTLTTLGALARHAGPGGGPGSSHVTAATLLNKIAVRAEHAPAPKPRDDQFTVVGLKVGTGGPKLESEITWTSVSNICTPSLFRANGDNGIGLGQIKPCPSIGSIDGPTYRLLETLPTDPKKLLELIKTAKPRPVESVAVAVPERLGPSAREFERIGNLLDGAIAPPKLFGALYRAAAMIPGVTVVQHAVDAIGRTGIAVAFTHDGVRSEWIFNRKTLDLLGETDVWVSDGKVRNETAITLRGIVDHKGEFPKSH